MTQNNKINFILLNTGLFCFLFLWDLKFDIFQFRYLIILPFFLLIFNNKIYNLKNLFNIFLFPNLILIHFFLNIFLNDYNLEFRDVFGLFFLYIIFLVTLQNINNIEKSLEIIINIFTILFSISFIIFFIYSNSQINLDCYDGWFFKHKFIFLENSHFSLISVAIINYYILFFCEKSNYKIYDYINILFFIIFFIISVVNFSTTFLIGLTLMQFYLLFKNFKKRKIVILSIILILMNSLIIFNYKQCNERSIGSIKPIYDLMLFKNKFQNETLKEKKEILNNNNFRINMSVETLLVSLEITFKSLLNNPFGVGFNKYHLAHREYIDQIIKTDNSVKKNNVYDGSTNISKIVTEFGIFGILLILFFLFTLLKREKINHVDIFIISLICMQFLRGVGYFNGGFILIFLVYFYKFKQDKLKSN